MGIRVWGEGAAVSLSAASGPSVQCPGWHPQNTSALAGQRSILLESTALRLKQGVTTEVPSIPGIL